MDPVVIVRRVLRFAMRSLLVPALVAATLLGLSGGRHGTASVSPSAVTIASTLSAKHDLPKNTRLTLGDPKKPTVVTYDAKGRLLLTPPEGETFGTILYGGLTELTAIAKQAGVNLTGGSVIGTQTAALTKP